MRRWKKLQKQSIVVSAVSIFTHIFIEKRQFRLIQHRAFNPHTGLCTLKANTEIMDYYTSSVQPCIQAHLLMIRS
jgi:hypothetical protein